MCRGRSACTELPGERATWNRLAPLSPLPWLPEVMAEFRAALEAVARHDAEEARRCLRRTRSDDLREHFEEHGQMAYRFRGTAASWPAASMSAKPVARMPSRADGMAIMERDGFRCRYCDVPVAPDEVLTRVRSVVGEAAFGLGRTNATRHGLRLTVRAELDHVVPFRAGGDSSLANVVTCCPNCNYGKYNLTCEELGIIDPRCAEAVTARVEQRRIHADPWSDWADWDGGRLVLGRPPFRA